MTYETPSSSLRSRSNPERPSGALGHLMHWLLPFRKRFRQCFHALVHHMKK
jgi:hypothetical protein